MEHEHHSNAEHHHDDHQHVEHNDHLDEGILNYVICLLSEVEHSDSDTDQPHLLLTRRNVRCLQCELNIGSAIVLSDDPHISNDDLDLSGDLDSFQYSDAERASISERGPPSIG